MKHLMKLLAMLLILSLLPVCAAEAQPGARLTLSDFRITIGEAEFYPDLTANIDGVSSPESAFGGFFLTLGEQTLLPVQTRVAAEGVRLKLGGSSVYCFTPEWFAGLSGYPSMAEWMVMPVSTRNVQPFALGEEFMALLQDKDELPGDAVMSWLESALGLQAGTLAAISETELPPIRIEAIENGYALRTEDQDGEPVALTRRDDVIALTRGENFSLTLQKSGAADLNYQASTFSEGYLEDNVSIQFSLAPSGAEADFTFRYDYACDYVEDGYYTDDCAIGLTLTGRFDEAGACRAEMEFAMDGNYMPDIAAACRVTLAAAQVQDDLTGANAITVSDYTDESVNNLLFAAMGLLGDVEKLRSDDTIKAMVEHYSALDAAAREAWDAQQGAKIELTKADLDFPVPEFTHIPEGFALEKESVYTFAYYAYYVNAEDERLDIYVQSTPDREDYTYVPGEALAPAEHPTVSVNASEYYQNIEIYINGAHINMEIPAEHALSLDEIARVLDGMAWPEG